MMIIHLSSKYEKRRGFLKSFILKDRMLQKIHGSRFRRKKDGQKLGEILYPQSQYGVFTATKRSEM